MSKSNAGKNPRLIAVYILNEVFQSKCSLSESVFNKYLGQAQLRDQNFIKEICYGVLRWHNKLEYLAGKLTYKKFKNKDFDVYLLILIGIYQLLEMRVADYAAVTETVNACQQLKKPWAKALVNAVLRSFIKQQQELLAQIDEVAIAEAHPAWLVQMLHEAWPLQWQEVLAANNQRPQLALRVDTRQISREDYVKKSASTMVMHPEVETCVLLEKGGDVTSLPGFASGEVSVQDASAQCAMALMQLQPGMRVLDACAAPGGKTMHMLQAVDNLQMVALDKNAERLQRVQENLDRLQLSAQLLCADAAKPEAWWDGKQFDRILLDAPCSGTGVIRRHPDIKWLRTPEDVLDLVQQQTGLLDALWSLLKDDGILVYATCSILPEENVQVVKKFIAKNPQCEELKIEKNWGCLQDVGRQILPNENMDGFFYACLKKVKL